MSKCPHCGNIDVNTIEDNGLHARALDYTMLCVARLDPKDAAVTRPLHEYEPDDFDAAGRVKCGCQWSPNAA